MAGGESGGQAAGEGPGALPDEALAQRVRAGDRQSLEELVRRYVRPVHVVVASFLSEPDDVDDAAQETFLRALRAIDRYDMRRPFAPWIYQIARNVARNQLAALTRRRTEPFSLEGPEGSDPTPDQEAERAEIRARVDERLAYLPEQRRTAFRLVDVEGMAAEEAGRIMGISPGTVRSHVHHARRALREALWEYVDVTRDAGGRE